MKFSGSLFSSGSFLTNLNIFIPNLLLYNTRKETAIIPPKITMLAAPAKKKLDVTERLLIAIRENINREKTSDSLSHIIEVSDEDIGMPLLILSSTAFAGSAALPGVKLLSV